MGGICFDTKNALIKNLTILFVFFRASELIDSIYSITAVPAAHPTIKNNNKISRRLTKIDLI